MKIRILVSGEGPTVGIITAGDEIGESRISVEEMKILIDRGIAEEVEENG